MQLPADFIGSRNPQMATLDLHPENFRGTTVYTPPEILDGKPYIRAAADIWAMGLVLCEMITGVPPFLSMEALMCAQLYYGAGERTRKQLLPVWYLVGSCLHWNFLMRPSAAELQLRDDYLPILLERQQLIGDDIENNWADGMTL